jgi:hypothetical protein
VTGPRDPVFFADAPAPSATPYLFPGHHSEDEFALVAVALERAATRAAATPDVSTAGLDARLATMRQWIDARVAATRDAEVRLPLLRVAARLGLGPVERDIVAALVAVEVEPRRLLVLTPPGGIPPTALSAAVLHHAVAAPGVSTARFVRELIGPGGLLPRGIVTRADDPVPQFPTAAAPLRVGRGLIAAVLGTEGRDPLLDGVVARLGVTAEASASASAERARLVAAMTDTRGVALWLTGPRDDARDLAVAVATQLGRLPLAIDLPALARDSAWARHRTLAALAVDQQLGGWIGVIEVGEGDDLGGDLRALVAAATGPLIAITTGDAPALAAVARTAVRHHLQRPSAAERRPLWQQALTRVGATLPERHLLELAEGFPMGGGEIRDVVAAAARGQVAAGGGPTLDELRAACMSRQRTRLGRLADYIPPAFSWDDLVLAEEERERLREIAARHAHRHTVLTVWNMVTKLPYGTGTAALFSGPPGTGKTMAASVLAGQLGRELYRIDLSRVVDKYVGETEKNLGRIFDAAADADAILLFDEADSLFGKRTQVQSSHDRYANLETNYLLQRIEQHPGVSILTTNHVQNLDEAFARRVPFRVEFPFPDEVARTEIWRRSFASEVPRADLDYAWLGRSFELAGGHIKSAVVRAVFMAADGGTAVTMDHLARAAALEFEAMGKLAPVRRREPGRAPGA